jgi:NAD(P)-dependent dehydrogenase (short-subunit alcohol dehydrogenase family)
MIPSFVLAGQPGPGIALGSKSNKMSKVIFITGASRGFGRLWAEGFLKRGDKVVATARNLKTLADLSATYGDNLLPLELDVNDRAAGFAAVQKARAKFGRIDVLINNAGFGLFGAIEETTEQQARQQMETNFFGLLWMTQAVLPIMREQKSGHIIQLSSILGLTTLPVLGLYNASKFAVEGLSETLATEVKSQGIHVTMVEPNGFSTDWSGASAVQTTPMEVYEPVKKAFFEGSEGIWGDPAATTAAILKLVDAQNPPLRLLLGKFAYDMARAGFDHRVAEFDQWKEVSVAAHG